MVCCSSLNTSNIDAVGLARFGQQLREAVFVVVLVGELKNGLLQLRASQVTALRTRAALCQSQGRPASQGVLRA